MRKKITNNELEVKQTIIKAPISKFIDTQFRDYALYVLESRGIPSFYDGMTNVQRYIINNAPSNYSKTLTVVGSCISDFYHHGDIPVGKAISRMARPFGNSTQLLEGYGYLGTEVQEQAAAPRYTSVRLAPQIREMVTKYKHLNSREIEGPYNPFWLEIPIGLAMPMIGIAVGYKTTILPRKLDEVSKYIKGSKKADLKPFFKNFNGTVERYNTDKCWLISSSVNVEGSVISVTNIPPVAKYSSVIKRLDTMLSKYEGKYVLYNNSKDVVDIQLNYKGKNALEFKEICQLFKKVFSVVITESLVFVKDGKVLEYDSIKDYLTDWRWQYARLKSKDAEYKLKFCESEIQFNEAKKLFVDFMVNTKRTVKEINQFYASYDMKIVERLDRLNPKHFTIEESKDIEKKIGNLKKEYIELEQLYKSLSIQFDALDDPTKERSIVSKRSVNTLFDESDFKEIDGVMVWCDEDAQDMMLDEVVEEII